MLDRLPRSPTVEYHRKRVSLTLPISGQFTDQRLPARLYIPSQSSAHAKEVIAVNDEVNHRVSVYTLREAVNASP